MVSLECFRPNFSPDCPIWERWELARIERRKGLFLAAAHGSRTRRREGIYGSVVLRVRPRCLPGDRRKGKGLASVGTVGNLDQKRNNFSENLDFSIKS